jgi:lysophospholipase L1-like esterase
VSRDEGISWTSHPLFREPGKFEPSIERALLRTRRGTVIAAWINLREKSHAPGFLWGGPPEEFAQWILPTYVCRSHDDGRTWDAPILLNRPWCGCIHSFIETCTGRLVLVGQEIIPEWRHATVVFVSDDDGLNWRRSHRLDIGGPQHDHAGSCEGTVLERQDGSLYLLLRTETGFLYEVASTDGGLNWVNFRSSGISSVTCCAQLYRLSDGSVALLWNAPPRHDPRDGTKRDELAIAFSTDDARTWSAPHILAADYPQPRPADHWWRVAYPYLYERRPGELWITTMQGDVRLRIAQSAIAGSAIPPPPLAIMFGDSTTARRPGAVREPYAGRVQRQLESAGRSLAVANQGVGGNTTRDALARLAKDVLAYTPRLVVLQFGINDASVDVWLEPPATGPRVPLPEFADNLRQMVRTLRAQGAAIILMTTNRVYWSEVLRGLYSRPPYDQTAREGFNRPWLDEYNRIIREVAKRENVSLVDINAAYTGHPDPSSLLLPDRIHPADPGHELVANLLGPVILKTLPPVQ